MMLPLPWGEQSSWQNYVTNMTMILGSAEVKVESSNVISFELHSLAARYAKDPNCKCCAKTLSVWVSVTNRVWDLKQRLHYRVWQRTLKKLRTLKFFFQSALNLGPT